jgi:hypothetical protein
MLNRDIRNIADLNLERFKNNNAREGQNFGNDKLINSDFMTCKEVSVVVSATQL